MLLNYLFLSLLAGVVATAATRWGATLLGGPRISRLIEGRLREEVFSRMFPLVILFCLIFKELVPWEVAANAQLSLIKLASVLAVVYVHVWKRNLFLSVIGGTAFFVAARYLITGQ
jgi:branched-subunit amino acid transport protein AzlD